MPEYEIVIKLKDTLPSRFGFESQGLSNVASKNQIVKEARPILAGYTHLIVTSDIPEVAKDALVTGLWASTSISDISVREIEAKK